MLARLSRIPPGTMFRLPTMPEVRGVLVACSDCSATVRLTRGLCVVEVEDRAFVANRGSQVVRWSTATLVEVLCEPDPNQGG